MGRVAFESHLGAPWWADEKGDTKALSKVGDRVPGQSKMNESRQSPAH